VFERVRSATNPLGVKGVGEVGPSGVAAAIGNAVANALSGARISSLPITPERVLAALRAKRGDKVLNLTEGVDPTVPTHFREHGGSLWYRGKGPDRHPLDPSRREAPAQVGGDD